MNIEGKRLKDIFEPGTKLYNTEELKDGWDNEVIEKIEIKKITKNASMAYGDDFAVIFVNGRVDALFYTHGLRSATVDEKQGFIMLGGRDIIHQYWIGRGYKKDYIN